MKAAILCVGTEIVTGLVKDRNASFLTDRLFEMGILTKLILCTDDEKSDISRALVFSLADPDISLVIVTGGLGPTEDDITREAVAETLNRKLCFHEKSWLRIERFYQALRGAPPPPNNRKQAMIPEGAQVIPNGRGTAPGFMIEQENQVIFVIPGVPAEVEHFWGAVQKAVHSEEPLCYRSRILRFCGIGESSLEEAISPLLRTLSPRLKPAFLPNFGEVWFHLYGDSPTILEKQASDSLLATIEQKLDQYCFSLYGETTEAAVGHLLIQSNRRLAVAESCTGGLLCDRLTAVPGSSRYFERGYVVYSNLAKQQDLAVPEEIMLHKGAVSPEVAQYLAESVRLKCQVDFGIGITGIAGPGGGTPSKPVGLVYIACAGRETTRIQRFQFPGERSVIKRLTTQYALSMLFTSLLSEIQDASKCKEEHDR